MAAELVHSTRLRRSRHLEKALLDCYGSSTLGEQMRLYLNKTLTALQADVRWKIQMAHPSIDKEILEDIGREVFLNALVRQLRTRIRDRGLKMLQEAVRMGMEIERYDNESPGRDAGKFRPSSRTRRVGAAEEAMMDNGLQADYRPSRTPWKSSGPR